MAGIDPSPLTLSFEDLLPTMWPTWFTECLTYFQLLLTIDSSNVTGISDQDILNQILDLWLGPLQCRWKQLKREAAEKQMPTEANFILDRWEDAIDRVERAVSKLPR